MQLAGGRRDERGLVALVLGVVADDAVAAAGVGPQVLRLARRVVGDDRVGGVEDGLRAAVVLVEHDGGDLGERLLELQDVAEVGAAEPVDRLVRVADDGDVVVAAGEQQDDLVLRLVGVLVLVDEDVLEALAVVVEHVGVVAEQAHGVDEQVVEVHRPGLLQAGLVLARTPRRACGRRCSAPARRRRSGPTSSFFHRLIRPCTPRGVKRLASRWRSRMTYPVSRTASAWS